jgi:hypothetical protein
MLVSIDPRPRLPGPNSAWNADPKNGHEWNPAADRGDDLQYACNFDLQTPRVCPNGSADCDCSFHDPKTTQNPLCQDPNTGEFGSTQFKAKAYPGIRELQVLKGVGDQGIVASICPPNTRDPSASDFGYRPVMKTILDRLRVKLRASCLPRALKIDEQGRVPCVVLEAFTPKAGKACDCADPAVPGRTVPSPDLLTPEITAAGPCICQIEPLAGDARAACERGDGAFGNASGWCYIDPLQSHDVRQCDLVAKCPDTQRRILRYFGVQPRGRAVVTCQERAFSPELSPEHGDICKMP